MSAFLTAKLQSIDKSNHPRFTGSVCQWKSLQGTDFFKIC